MRRAVEFGGFCIPAGIGKSSFLRFALAAAIFVAHPFAARAQVVVAPSQVTPQNLRPAPTNAPSGPAISGPEALQAPAGANRVNVVVRRLAIEGGFPELEYETRALAQPIEGQRVTIARIYEFANALEQAYARAGYVLVRVTVPPQKLIDRGDVRIVIVDGFIEKVQVDNVAERVRELVAARTASLVGRRHITLAEIERSLLIAGDVPGLRLKSTLARGASPGGALLVLEGTQQLITGTVGADDLLPASLGTWSYGGDVALNSPFGFGEQLYASARAGGDPGLIFNNTSPFWLLGAGIVVPLGLEGWTFNPEYTNSRTQTTPGMGALANVGRFQRLALRTSYPLIRTRSQVLTLTGAFEYIVQNVTVPLLATDLSEDRYGAVRVGAAYDSGLPWLNQTLQASAVFSHGTGGRDGADAVASGVSLSQEGANPFFAKANVDARLIQPLPESFQIDLIGRGQDAFGKPLLVPEQFQLDGPLAVSGYPIGTLNVDQGASLRGELSRSFLVQSDIAPFVLTQYGFGAFGIGRLLEPTVLEVGVQRAASFGVGLRSNVDMPNGYQGASLGLEVARQYSDLETVGHGWRGNVTLNVRF
jgi:hemolysin activation/secretion protein